MDSIWSISDTQREDGASAKIAHNRVSPVHVLLRLPFWGSFTWWLVERLTINFRIHDLWDSLVY